MEVGERERPASAATWHGVPPPELGAPPLVEQLRGAARLIAFLAVTTVGMVPFLAGRALRQWLGPRVTFHFHVATLWSRATLVLCGLSRTVQGTPVTAGALVANHSSWADIPALRSIGLLYFVSKDDVAGWPGVGLIARVTGTVFIARRRTEAKRQEAMLRERIAARQRLCFFPEGTSTDGLRVLPFKSSLFSVFFLDGHGADLLIQPVTVRYQAPPGLPPEFYGWWGDMAFGAHVWQVFCRSRGGGVEVTFHEPVRPDDFPDRKALAEYAFRAVAAAMPQP